MKSVSKEAEIDVFHQVICIHNLRLMVLQPPFLARQSTHPSAMISKNSVSTQLDTEASQSHISWSKAIAVASSTRITIVWAIYVAFYVMSTDFTFDILPPPLLRLPFEFCVFTSWMNIFSSDHLPTTFTWGHYYIKAYFGQCPHSESVSSAIIDYTNLSADGKIVKELTSTTCSLTQCNLYGIFSKVGKGHSPAVTLIERLEPSQCWAFHRDAGQLRIQLTHPIHISSLAVGHTNISSMASAPKKLILQGLKPTNSNLCTVLQDEDTLSPDFSLEYCGICLLSIIYKPSCLTLYQSFPVTLAFSHYFNQLIVQILENWGQIGRAHV